MLSLWDYLRRRVSNAVLAGFHDAMSVIERADIPDGDHESAERLRQRFRNTVLAVTNKAVQQHAQNPNANGKHLPPPSQTPQQMPPTSPKPTPPLPSQRSLPLATPNNSHAEFQQPPQQTNTTTENLGSRRRGRPPKNNSQSGEQP